MQLATVMYFVTMPLCFYVLWRTWKVDPVLNDAHGSSLTRAPCCAVSLHRQLRAPGMDGR